MYTNSSSACFPRAHICLHRALSCLGAQSTCLLVMDFNLFSLLSRGMWEDWFFHHHKQGEQEAVFLWAYFCPNSPWRQNSCSSSVCVLCPQACPTLYAFVATSPGGHPAFSVGDTILKSGSSWTGSPSLCLTQIHWGESWAVPFPNSLASFFLSFFWQHWYLSSRLEPC
jgi:hypothetical protein